MGRVKGFSVLLACVWAVALVGATSSALADDWLPHPGGAKWTYFWTDNTYNPNGTVETVTVDPKAQSCGWQLDWTGTINVPLGSSGGSGGTQPTISQPDNGTMCFFDQTYGLVNTNWAGSSPPINEPPLCASSASGCPNSLASTLYDVIWGNRGPVISEPLLQGTSWTATGGGSGEVTSFNQYLGMGLLKVPAFPNGVVAAMIRTQVALAGTPGDDYGSGIRTTWWVRGVGPVKVVFDHVDGSVTVAELQSTSLAPASPKPDQDYFPLRVGLKGRYQWTNPRYLRQPEVETVAVAAAVNRSARLTVKSVSGPLRAAGDYVFSIRLDGLRATSGATSAATLAKMPKLGHGRDFFNPLDMMIYGFNPVLPAYPVPGTTWKSGNGRDLQTYGVTGTTRVIGVRSVRVPAGRFQALEVQSTLNQPGHPFGSGVRTMWFGAGRGLVKMVFKHRDGSTSVVQLLK